MCGWTHDVFYLEIQQSNHKLYAVVLILKKPKHNAQSEVMSTPGARIWSLSIIYD